MTAKVLPGQRGGSHLFAALTDQNETYGAHIIEKFAAGLDLSGDVVDIGAGGGRDLEIVKRLHPGVRTVALEASKEYCAALQGKVDEVKLANIERDRMPFGDESLDLIIANQILEHTKEIFWIFHEVARTLKVGGHFLIGVPNVASFHNRLLMLAGIQPTQHKLYSAHVRPFSKGDTIAFMNNCCPGGFRLKAFAGSQFYPFPKTIARVAAGLFPAASFSIFFLFEKVALYTDSFATYPARARLETNFWVGDVQTGSSY